MIAALRRRPSAIICAAMDENMTAVILRVLERAPQWLRHDLESKDTSARRRAEETLAAMIADALANQTGTCSQG